MSEPGALMQADMAAQPDVLRGFVERRPDCLARLRGAAGDGLVGTIIVARGSSDYAAVFGRYLIEAASGRPVALAAASLSTLYDVDIDLSGSTAAVVGQAPVTLSDFGIEPPTGFSVLSINEQGTFEFQLFFTKA